MILVDAGSPISNGVSNDAMDTQSLHGTTKSGTASGWINVLAGGSGSVPGVSGQSTLSRKSGNKSSSKENIFKYDSFSDRYISKKYR